MRSAIRDNLWDVGAFIASTDDDDIIVEGGNFNTVSGAGGNDAMAFSNSAAVGTIFGGGGNDTISIGDSVNVVTMIDGGTGTDLLRVGIGNALSGVTISNIEGVYLVGGSSDDAMAEGSIGGVAFSGFDGGAGTDTVTLNDEVNTVFVTNVEAVVGGSLSDTVQLGDGGNTVDMSYVEVVSGGSGADNITFKTALNGVAASLGTGADSVTLGNFANSIAVNSVESITGGSLNDVVTFGANQTGSVDLGSGTADTVNLYVNGGTNTLDLWNVEIVNAVSGTGANDILTFHTVLNGAQIALREGTDSVVLADGENSVTLSDVDLFTGGNGNDAVTQGNVMVGNDVYNFGGGTNDSLALANGTNSVTVSGLELLNGNAGNDTVKIAVSEVAALTFHGLGGTDSISLIDGGTLADAAFEFNTSVEQLVLADAAGYNITLGSNALSASGGSLLVDGSALTSNGATVSASAFSGNLTVDFANSTANDQVTVGAGAVNVDLGGGDTDKVLIQANSFDSGDTLNGGAGIQDQIWLLGGGTVADSAFTNVSGFEYILLANSAFSLALDTAASTAFSSGINIDGQSVVGNSISITSSAGLTANLTLDLVNSTVADDIWTGSGTADDIVLGGGDDILRIGAADLSAGDTLDGGAGTDILFLDTGGTVAGSAWGSGVKTNFETLQLGNDTSFDITLNDDAGAVFGGTITVNGSAVAAGSVFLRGASLSASYVIDADFSGDTVATDLKGGAGNDILRGGSAADLIYGGDGNDIIYAGAGNDTGIGGEGGDDTIYAGDGADSIEGDDGNDTIYGEGGNDTLLNGENGDDYLDGGTGDDVLSAGAGADTLVGGTGADTIQLGTSDAAIDLVRYDSVNDGSAAGIATGNDTVTGFEVGTDTVGIAGSLRALMNDINATDGLAWVIDTSPATGGTGATVNFAGSDEALLIQGFTDTALTNLTTIAGAIDLAAGNSGGNGLILAQGGANSALYVYQDTSDTTTVSAGELQLLAIFDTATVGTSDVVLA